MLIIFLSLIFLFSFQSVYAEESHLEEIIVTATKYDEEISKIPSFITVISEEDIKNSTAQTIPDILRKFGIHVSDITGNKRTFNVDIRGFGETSQSNLLVLIDGMKINQPDLSGSDWLLIPLERVEKIEIIRSSAGSVLYGDNATGGVINIITKKAEKLNAGTTVSAGSYETFKQYAYATAELNAKAAFYLSGSYLNSDGYRRNSDIESKDLGLKLNYSINNNINIKFNTGYHKDNTGLPGALKESDISAGISRKESTHPNDFSETEDYYFNLTPEIYFMGDNIFKIDLSYRKRAWISFASGDWGDFLGDSEMKTFGILPQFIFKQKFSIGKNSLTAGFDYHNTTDKIINKGVSFGFPFISEFKLKKKNYGYYLHDELNVLENLSISAGYRHDIADFYFHPSNTDTLSMREDIYTFGANYKFYKESYAYISFTKSFRYPLLDELYSFYTNTVNTRLNPQKSYDYEIGLRYYFNDNIYSNINFFRIYTYDEIFLNPVTYNNENLDGKTRRDGIEFSLNAKVFSWLTLFTNYSYINAKIKDGQYEGKNIPNVPKHKASFGLTSDITKELSLYLDCIYVGSRPFISDFSNSFDKQKDYLVFNTKITYKNKNIRAFLDINNLFNKKYSEYGVLGGFPVEKAYYPSPGRNFLIGLSVNL